MAGSALWSALVLILGWRALTGQIHAQVETTFALERAEHAAELASLAYVDRNGELALRQPLSDPRFLVERSGYYWEIRDDSGAVLRSPSLGGADLPVVEIGAPPSGREIGPSGPVLIQTAEKTLSPGREAHVEVATDIRLHNPLVKSFDVVTRRILALLAFGLVAMMAGQAVLGFRPLSRLQREVRRVRSGGAKRLSDDFPRELRPTVTSLNSLLETNEAIVERSRVLAGNLAHSLKTPLSIIVAEATAMRQGGGDPEIILRKCERMRRIVDFQLSRIRAASNRGAAGARLPLAPAIENLARALRRLYPYRTLQIDLAPEAVSVACEQQDFDEMFANLLDNALKWSRSTVRVTTCRRGGDIRCVVEDDGPGMTQSEAERMFRIGERLDEQTPGSGFGLAIVRELAALSQGSVRLDASRIGGLRAELILPIAG